MTAELLRENKRMLDKAIRDLDRERMGLQNQEKKLVAEIKKTAKQGQMVFPILPSRSYSAVMRHQLAHEVSAFGLGCEAQADSGGR